MNAVKQKRISSYTAAMFKPLFYASIPLLLTSNFAVAQNNAPTKNNPIALNSAKKIFTEAGSIKSGDKLIVPGKRIGPIALNATRKEVETILGSPPEWTRMGEDSNFSVWRWKKQTKEQTDLDWFKIIFQKNRVVQIETNAAVFALPNGLTIQSPVADWTQLWGSKPERRTVILSVIGTPMHLTWKNVGFAIKVPWESKIPGDTPIQSVIVLPKNRLARSTFSLLTLMVSAGPAPKIYPQPATQKVVIQPSRSPR